MLKRLQRPVPALLVLAIALVTGWSKPRLDTSSTAQFHRSTAEVRENLRVDARAA